MIARKLAVHAFILGVITMTMWGQAAPAPAPPSPTNAVPTSPQKSAPAPTATGQPLSILEAEALALKNNPQISVARLTALAAQQVHREVRSALLPTAVGNLTAVDPHEGSRIAAGGLNNPVIFQRAAYGTSVYQLITDFGRTTSLSSSSDLRAKAADQNAIATRDQILLGVDAAFYGALQSQAVLRVAEETVRARQAVADQVNALFKAKLKSELDASFANVNLAQAQLLLLDAQNNAQTSLANLSVLLGYPSPQDFALQETTEPVAAPPTDVDRLVTMAMNKRPEIRALDFNFKAAEKFHAAERDLMFPTVRALGTVGGTPLRDPQLSSWFGAVGVNVEIPVFNGFLYSARAKEADLRAKAALDELRDLQNRIARDVRTSWLNANAAYDKMNVSQQLLNQANLALDLAQTRYQLGLGSIVELSQAQLQQTQAVIGNTQAGYDYRLALATLKFQTGM